MCAWTSTSCHAGTCRVNHSASNLLKYMNTLPVGFCKRPCSSLPCLQALLRMCEDANTSWEGHLSWLLPEPSPADCIIIHESQSQPRTQWCCATLTGGIPKEVPRDGAWLNSQESLSLSLPLSNSGLDAYTLWLLTGIAHCHAHHSLQAQQRIATTAALSLSLSCSLHLYQTRLLLSISLWLPLSCIWSVLHFLPAEAGDNSTLHTGRHSYFPLWSCRCSDVAGLFRIGCDSERDLYWVRVERAILMPAPTAWHLFSRQRWFWRRFLPLSGWPGKVVVYWLDGSCEKPIIFYHA